MKKILLVDDEKWVRTALKGSLNKLELPLKVIHECQNGLEALDWLKQNNIDLVLTDIRMPIMDGLSFVKELAKLKSEQDVIIISVHDEFSYIQEALRCGVTDYVLKPIEESDLKASLEKWLDRVDRKKEDSKEMAEKSDLSSSTIDLVLDYINNTPLHQVTLKEAANHVHLNPSYLSQLFKKQFNKKFVDYLTEQKIQEGKRLLLNTSLRLSDIAERLGYSDLAYFSNNFKKITGFSPSEYRRIKGKGVAENFPN